MSNPLFQMLTGQVAKSMPGPMNILQQFMQFRQMFRGDPRQQVQQMLNSGKVSQEQYNQAVQLAKQLQSMLGG